MNFGNGCWLQKEGCECFAPQEIYFLEKENDKVTICAPTVKIAQRGDTLGGINLTVEVTSPMPEVFRIRVMHHLGIRNAGPSFELNPVRNEKLDVQETDELIQIRSGSLSLKMHRHAFDMLFERDGELITKSTGKDLAFMKTEWRGLAYDRGSRNAYMRQQLSLSVGETVYGMGERFTAFVKNGQSVDIWNEDGGTSTDQSYKNVPFYISSKGYGVFVNHTEKVSFEAGTEQASRMEFSVPGEVLDYYLFNGPTMKQVLERYTDLTGKPSLPPQWTFGLWLSTSFTTNYDEKTVMSFIDGMAERGIPLQVFHFDCFWMKEFHWTDFVWDSRVFPDPEGMLRRIRQKGLKICVWINPYIAQESVLFKEGMEKGYFAKRQNGDVWQWDMWQPGMAFVDFTNPEACAWYQSKLEKLLDMGVDCFKTDFGERIPTDDVVWHDGSDPDKMHNFYTYLYNRTVYELLQKKKGKEEAVVFARSATAGSQKFPVHWGGDCWSNYEAMAESLRGGLSLTMSGFGYWSHDIGGFENTSTPDVYKRWAAFGLLSSHSRLHGSSSYRVPWVYDEEAVDVVRFFTKMKLSLLPYLYSTAKCTSLTGIPVMRSMILEFMNDPACQYLDRQYMLGEAMLAAPIFNENGMASYYLPAGRWTAFLTGETTDGGGWRSEHHDYLSIPLWVRENSIIPVCEAQKQAEDPYMNNLTFRIYEPAGTKELMVAGENGETAAVRMKCEDGLFSLETDLKYDCRICLVNRTVQDVTGAVAETSGRDTILRLESTSAKVTCRIQN